MSRKASTLLLGLSFVLSLWLHGPFLQRDVQGIHSWRQSQTMWNVRNFVRHDNNILNSRVSDFNDDNDNLYRYEFPIMQWTAAQLQRVFGERIFVVRLFLFFLGILAVTGIYALCMLLWKEPLVALGTAFLFQFAPIFYYYTINPIPDLLALSAGIWHLFFILRHRQHGRFFDLVSASACIALSVGAKLPYIILTAPSVLFFMEDLLKGKRKGLVVFSLIQFLMLLPILAWYSWVMPGWKGNPVLTGFWESGTSLSEYGNIISYHLRKMFPLKLLYPLVWVFVLFGIRSLRRSMSRYTWLLALVVSTFLYWGFELHAISKVHDYYMMPFLPWLYLLIGIGINEFLSSRFKFKNAVLMLLLVCAPVYTSLTSAKLWSLEKTHFNHDALIYSEALKQAVPNDARCIILRDRSRYIFSYQIDKMGYIFDAVDFPAAWMADMIGNSGAQYLYSDSRGFDEREDIVPYLGALIESKGSIRVYELVLPTE